MAIQEPHPRPGSRPVTVQAPRFSLLLPQKAVSTSRRRRRYTFNPFRSLLRPLGAPGIAGADPTR